MQVYSAAIITWQGITISVYYDTLMSTLFAAATLTQTQPPPNVQYFGIIDLTRT